MEGTASGGGELFETPPFVVEIDDALSRADGALRGQCFQCKRETVVWPFVLPEPVRTQMRILLGGATDVTLRTLLTCNDCAMQSMRQYLLYREAMEGGIMVNSSDGAGQSE